MAVLHVVTSTQRRGAETFATDLAADLAARDLPGELVALTRGDDEAPLPIPVLGPGALPAVRALRRHAAAARVVIAHGSRTLPACAVALAGRGVPFVYRSIGDPAVWSGRGVRRMRTAALLRRAHTVTVLWHGAADTLIARHGVAPGRIRVIPNGVAAARCPVPDDGDRQRARRQFGLPDDAPVAGYAGSLTAEKQVHATVDAVAAMPGVHLLVAGAGPERAALEARAAAVAPSRVHFAGALSDPAPVFAAADVIVLTSRTEGMPGVLIEAGLSGRPAVAFAIGGVPEVVVDGETGVLVAPGDGRALVAALRRAFDDAGAMGAAARRRCLDRFEIGVVGAQWAGLLTEVMR